ncbi:hypothetical protein VFPFJ_01772 [Purpureocillium lilacinum]|uniref:Uncharacterized protein n=1 Tax=Purpureocillium lilacinum TaxID=33203 RepID=A0A179HSS8_PURLI|nr:hypothetical protein VFPFJ_01772 [Purpureocillium lilacinum]OAQ92611.1 hypothetical protein VFPFJ_01772 [Purpureocillium lilacinum]
MSSRWPRTGCAGCLESSRGGVGRHALNVPGSVCRAAIPRARSTGSQQPLRRQTAGARCGSLGSFQGPAFWNRRHTGPSTARRGDCLRARWVRWRGRDIEKWDCIIDIPPISVTNPDSLSNYRAPQPSSPRRTGRPASYISSRICPLFRASPPPQLSTRPLMFRVFRHFFSTTPSPQRQAAMATASDKAQKLINENAVSTCAPSSLLDPQRKTATARTAATPSRPSRASTPTSQPSSLTTNVRRAHTLIACLGSASQTSTRLHANSSRSRWQRPAGRPRANHRPAHRPQRLHRPQAHRRQLGRSGPGQVRRA